MATLNNARADRFVHDLMWWAIPRGRFGRIVFNVVSYPVVLIGELVVAAKRIRAIFAS